MIKGILQSSFIDWDGEICSVVFTGGCNYKCGFCHNPELIEKDGILFFRYRNIDRELITSDGITFFVDESMKLVLTRENNGFNYLSLSFREFPGKRKIKKALV